MPHAVATVLSEQALQVGAVNAAIVVTLVEDGAAVNLSTATSKQLVFRKPRGVVEVKDASFVTDGTDGQLVYFTEEGFLDRPGKYQVQADVVYPGSGYDGPSQVGEFPVLENIFP